MVKWVWKVCFWYENWAIHTFIEILGQLHPPPFYEVIYKVVHSDSFQMICPIIKLWDFLKESSSSLSRTHYLYGLKKCCYVENVSCLETVHLWCNIGKAQTCLKGAAVTYFQLLETVCIFTLTMMEWHFIIEGRGSRKK